MDFRKLPPNMRMLAAMIESSAETTVVAPQATMNPSLKALAKEFVLLEKQLETGKIVVGRGRKYGTQKDLAVGLVDMCVTIVPTAYSYSGGVTMKPDTGDGGARVPGAPRDVIGPGDAIERCPTPGCRRLRTVAKKF
jgi:hypothetical protein